MAACSHLDHPGSCAACSSSRSQECLWIISGQPMQGAPYIQDMHAAGLNAERAPSCCSLDPMLQAHLQLPPLLLNTLLHTQPDSRSLMGQELWEAMHVKADQAEQLDTSAGAQPAVRHAGAGAVADSAPRQGHRLPEPPAGRAVPPAGQCRSSGTACGPGGPAAGRH